VKPVCAICNDARWIKEAVPFGHPHFGVVFPCACLQAEWARRTANDLARLSNLDAVQDKTFATLNPFVPGLREVLPHSRRSPPARRYLPIVWSLSRRSVSLNRRLPSYDAYSSAIHIPNMLLPQRLHTIQI
jgi:hypothetical protein